MGLHCLLQRTAAPAIHACIVALAITRLLRREKARTSQVVCVIGEHDSTRAIKWLPQMVRALGPCSDRLRRPAQPMSWAVAPRIVARTVEVVGRGFSNRFAEAYRVSKAKNSDVLPLLWRHRDLLVQRQVAGGCANVNRPAAFRQLPQGRVDLDPAALAGLRSSPVEPRQQPHRKLRAGGSVFRRSQTDLRHIVAVNLADVLDRETKDQSAVVRWLVTACNREHNRRWQNQKEYLLPEL